MLHLRLSGKGFSWHAAKELEVLTDKAVLELNSVLYAEHLQTLTVTLRRHELASGEDVKRRLFTSYRYTTEQSIKTKLILRNIVECRLERMDCGLQEASLIFGAQLRHDSLLLRSSQELKGKSCFFLEARFTQLDLDLQDFSKDP